MAFTRFPTLVVTTLALVVLAACATQSPEPPPPPPEPDPPTMDIWTAASEGNIAELAANKHAGNDLDGQAPEFQITPLTMAAIGGQAEAAQWLLDNGANVNGTNGDGSTALNAAAFLGSAGVAKVLVDSGVDTSIRNYDGQSAEDIAQFDWNTTEYIAAMLELEVEREAVESGRVKILSMIRGGSSGGGWEELATAIVTGDAGAVKAALAGGADVNARDPNLGGTALIAAAFLGQAEIAKMLLMAGADINATNNEGANALTVAELDSDTTEYIANMLQVPILDLEATMKGKAEIAEMLRAKM